MVSKKRGEEEMARFYDLVKQAFDFVETRKGTWDHEGWLNFLGEVQNKGYHVTEETQSYLGLILESIKKFNQNFPDAKERIIEAVCEEIVCFIEQTSGIWDHAGWENFLSAVKNKGIILSEGAISQSGSILEAAKMLYKSLPVNVKEEERETESVKELVLEPQETLENPPEDKSQTEPEPQRVEKENQLLNDTTETTKAVPLKIPKLTKKHLMELPEGHYLVSHAVDDIGNPIFAQEIPPIAHRDEFWQAVRDASLNQRVCYLFQNKSEYEAVRTEQSE